MSSGIWLDVSSLGILTILFIIYQYRNDIPIRQNKLLMSMAELAATATVCDIFCGLSVEGFILSTDWGYYVVKGLMVLAQSAISYCFFLYVQAIVKQKRTPSQRLWPQYAPFIIQIAAIMASLMGMLGKMGKSVLVEGVETKEQADIAIARGADFIQGYYFAKPLTQTEYLEFLKIHKN